MAPTAEWSSGECLDGIGSKRWGLCHHADEKGENALQVMRGHMTGLLVLNPGRLKPHTIHEPTQRSAPCDLKSTELFHNLLLA